MPLQSSKVLRRLRLGSYYFPNIVRQCPELEDVAARPLGDIIRRMENLEAFHASDADMSMTHWAQIAEALTWRGVSNLTELDLCYNGAIGTEEGFVILSRVLRVVSKLKRLDISSVRMGEAAGKALGEAVAVHQELEELALSPELEEWEDDGIQNSGNTQVIEGSKTGGPKECPLGRFITSAFLTDQPNQSVRSLRIVKWTMTDSQVLRLGVLSEFLRTTTFLSHFTLFAIPFHRSSGLRKSRFVRSATCQLLYSSFKIRTSSRSSRKSHRKRSGFGCLQSARGVYQIS
ncbi:hypothetical protein Mapa_016288 [Marchantia paleacea]|nr:hypothetical protein Mapa_016288 [Marchantia paleacea]